MRPGKRLEAWVLLQVPPPPKDVAADAEGVLRIRGYVALQQADSLILLAQESTDESLHGDEVLLGIELWCAPRPLDHRMGAVFQARPGDGGGDHHLLAQVNDLAPWRGHQGIDSREQSPGTRDVRLLQASHHVKLAFEEAKISRKASVPLLAPPLRLALLIEIVGGKEQPIENVRRVTEVRVLLVRASRRQRRALQIFGLVIEAAQRGERARQGWIDVRRLLEITAGIIEQRAGLLWIGRAGQLPAPVAQRAAQLESAGIL